MTNPKTSIKNKSPSVDNEIVILEDGSYDLNGDGKFDKQDLSIASKILLAGKKKK